jgi:hypothetical protein
MTSTTALQATEAVYEKVRTGWSATGFTFAAEHYTPPASAGWIRVVVRHLASLPASHGPTGGRHVTRRAEVVAQCFAPHAIASGDDGVAAALTLAETFRVLFQGIDLATVGGGALTFDTGDVRVVGTQGKWTQTHSSIPFTYEATF